MWTGQRQLLDKTMRLSQARSYHAGGVNALFMDGSVKFVINSIDRDTWRALGTRNGGEVVDSTKY